MSSENKNLNSLRKVVIWLADQAQVQSSELKRILLPFNYFPGVLIDEINEKSLELFDETAMEDDNGLVIVYQEILTKILPDLDAIESIANILDLELNEEISNKYEKENLDTKDVINYSMQPVAQQFNTGEDVFEEALNYYLPYGKYPQNEKEALRLFKKAGSLGCLDAYIYIADIYTDGGVFGDNSRTKQSYEKAIDYYNFGAKKGNIYCYYSMGLLYAIYKKDLINARKCFFLYAQKFQERSADSGLVISEENINTIASGVIGAIYKRLDGSYEASVVSVLIMEFSPVVREAVIRNLEEAIASTDGSRKTVAALKYFETYLQENC